LLLRDEDGGRGELLLLLGYEELLDDVGVDIFKVNLLVLQQLDNLLELILRDAVNKRRLLFLSLLLELLRKGSFLFASALRSFDAYSLLLSRSL